MRFMTGRSPFDAALAPSTVPMTAGRGQVGKFVGTLVWGTPKEMTLQDVAQVVDDFRRGADLAKASGWDGVQLHASHGYLLAQFLSPRVSVCASRAMTPFSSAQFFEPISFLLWARPI